MAFRDFLRNPFSFLFTRSSGEDRIAQYVIREHERGRPLADILDDPYIKNRTTPQEQARLLDRPEVVRALGHDVVESARPDLLELAPEASLARRVRERGPIATSQAASRST